MTTPETFRQQLRDRMRQTRRELGADTREWAAAELCRRITQSSHYTNASRFAAYFPFDGEIDTAPVIAHARDAGKTVYLPVLQPGNTLAFVHYSVHTVLAPNKFGIAEPVFTPNQLLDVRQLDLVLVPLVAFDYSLHRLGMGGGYYDRTLADLRTKGANGPKLLGIGYDLQCTETVQPQAWDIAADCIFTEACVYEPEK